MGPVVRNAGGGLESGEVITPGTGGGVAATLLIGLSV